MPDVLAHALCVKWAPVRHGRPERGRFATAAAFIVRQRLGYALQLDMDIVVHHCCCSFQARPLQARPVLVLVSIPELRIRLCRAWRRPWRSILPNDRASL